MFVINVKNLLEGQPFQMTKQQPTVIITQMHAVASTISEIFAFLTIFSPHPFTVPVFLIPRVPHLPEVIFINVALMIIRADAWASRNGTVIQHRCRIDSCITEEKVMTHLALIITEESLAAVT